MHQSDIEAEQCFTELASRENDIMIATQSLSLRRSIRYLPGHPLLFISHKAITLEKPSKQNQQSVDRHNSSLIKLPKEEFERVRKLKNEKCESSTLIKSIRKQKRSRKKERNPLSCLRPKAEREAKKREKNRIRKALKKKRLKHIQTDDAQS
ncbi:hypothetical protein GJ496_004991 [Pomphorhynchus laevis]|nr:hypothetical protein GJ496_004991 [Pomphorhynchus laevis]